MLIECPHCEAKVDGRLIGEREYGATDEYDPCKYVFLECPICQQPLLGVCESTIEYTIGRRGTAGKTVWLLPQRVWPLPLPHESNDPSIPQIVRTSLDDARKCFHAKVYTACAVMCGRALEAICKEKTSELTLARGLQKLKSTNQIDNRLFDWGEALRKERNIGAHASEETVSRLDAQDILDFANAITEYIYIMAAHR